MRCCETGECWEIDPNWEKNAIDRAAIAAWRACAHQAEPCQICGGEVSMSTAAHDKWLRRDRVQEAFAPHPGFKTTCVDCGDSETF